MEEWRLGHLLPSPAEVRRQEGSSPRDEKVDPSPHTWRAAFRTLGSWLGAHKPPSSLPPPHFSSTFYGSFSGLENLALQFLLFPLYIHIPKYVFFFLSH